MTVENPVDNLTKPRHCGSMGSGQNKTAPAGNRGLTTTPQLRRTVMADSHPTGPRTVADIIGPDPARWLAAIMGLPVEHVRVKLAAVRP